MLVTGAVLLVGLLSVWWSGPSVEDIERTRAQAIPQVSPDKVPLVTGEEPLEQIFIRTGCPVCHMIPGIVGARGRVGPKLVLGDTGPQRLADPGYQGRAGTVREYVIESVLTPGAYVVPGYPDRAMPRWYGKKMTAQALDKIAAYLEGITDAEQPSSGG